MKKLIFTAFAIVAFSEVSMANTIVEESKKDVAAPATVSCTRRITTTCEDGSSTTVISTQSVPSTGDYQIDMGNACSKALAKAQTMSLSAC
ncbi:hypothetical protein [Flavobacterium sp.]